MAKKGDIYTRSSMYSTIKCPHCERMFAEPAALRHIPICAHIVNKPKKIDEKKRIYLLIIFIANLHSSI